jgi:hypothetical protein
MAKYSGQWKTATIAATGTTSTEVDLGGVYSSLAVYIPAITTGTLALQTAMYSGGTFQNLYLISQNDADDDQVICSSGTGEINLTVPKFGWQYLKFVAGASQSSDVTIYCRGFD